MRTLRLDDVRAQIAGPARLLLIEAPAGHGKTFQAVSAAGEMSQQLERGQQVLLLSHTNAAREEVRRRFGPGVAARTQTLDSLACDIVSCYADHLGVVKPLRPGAVHLRQPSFETIRHLACQLLGDAPAVARALAWRYPVILVDEHQDSTRDQHELVWRIFEAGSARLRLFADRLQAIFDFAGDLISWPALVEAHGCVGLAHGFRWDGQPELRDFLRDARTALLRGDPVDLHARPSCVHVHRWVGRAPGPRQQGHCPECFNILRRLSLSGRVAYLVRNSDHGYGLAVRLGGLVKLYEAGDVSAPLAVLEAVHSAEGDAPALALLLCDTLRAWGTGILKDLRGQLSRACHSEGVDLSGRKRLVPLAEVCAPLFTEPTVSGFLRAFTAAVGSRHDLGWKPVRRDATFLMLAIPPESEDPLLALGAMAQAHRSREGPRSRVMTLHKSKGREFDTVVLPYASTTTFPMSEEGARLAYVGLTRAQRELHILVPSEGSTQLLAA